MAWFRGGEGVSVDEEEISCVDGAILVVVESVECRLDQVLALSVVHVDHLQRRIYKRVRVGRGMQVWMLKRRKKWIEGIGSKQNK